MRPHLNPGDLYKFDKPDKKGFVVRKKLNVVTSDFQLAAEFMDYHYDDVCMFLCSTTIGHYVYKVFLYKNTKVTIPIGLIVSNMSKIEQNKA